MSTEHAAFESYWMPFTANRDYKKKPRVIVGAEGHHYLTDDGRRVYDAFSGLWTCGLGHCHPKIVEAVQRQVAKLDYAIAFQVRPLFECLFFWVCGWLSCLAVGSVDLSGD